MEAAVTATMAEQQPCDHQSTKSGKCESCGAPAANAELCEACAKMYAPLLGNIPRGQAADKSPAAMPAPMPVPVELTAAPEQSDSEILAAEAARKLKEESAKAVAAKLVAEKVAAAEAATARLETDHVIRRMDPLGAAAKPASVPVPVQPKGTSHSMMLAAAAVALVVVGLGVTQGAAWFGLNPAPPAEARQPAPVQVADMNMTPTRVRRMPAPSSEAKPAAKEPRVVPVVAKPVTTSKPKPKLEAPLPSAAPLSSPAVAIRQEAPQALPEAPRAVATVASAPAGKLFERNEVDDAPQIVTRVEPKLSPGDLPSNDLVIVRVLVSQSGHPYRVSLLRGSKKGRQLDDAVVEAVNQWTFSPAKKRGAAVSCWFNIGVPLGRN